VTAGPCLGCSAGYHCHTGRDDSGALIPTPRCASCEKRATVTVRLLPRPHTPFSEAVSVPSCPSCLGAVKGRGAVLEMTWIAEAS
jgi:hypothetical protein